MFNGKKNAFTLLFVCVCASVCFEHNSNSRQFFVLFFFLFSFAWRFSLRFCYSFHFYFILFKLFDRDVIIIVDTKISAAIKLARKCIRYTDFIFISFAMRRFQSIRRSFFYNNFANFLCQYDTNIAAVERLKNGISVENIKIEMCSCR